MNQMPQGVMLGETGEGPFSPYCDLILKNDQTIQAIVGWFIIPLALSETIAWYQVEMAKQGWVFLTDRSSRLPESAVLRFEQLIANLRVMIDLRARPHTRQTDAMIRRIVVHPWAPVAEQPLELAAETA